MKKLIFFLFFVFLSFTVIAQDTGWETGINLSAGISDRFFTKGNIDGDNSFFVNQIKKEDSPAFYYSTGIYGRKFFRENYGIELGINYTSVAHGYKQILFTDINGGVVGTVKLSSRQNFVEVPLRFVFKNDFKLISVGCFIGIAPAVLTHAYTNFYGHYNEENGGEEFKNRKNETKNFTKFNLIADASLLVRFNITEHFAIDAKPFFRAFLLPHFNTSYGYNTKPFTGGLSASTVWKF